ncbi:ABC transporter permease [Desulfosarcina sp.]|uniref:ABC transporter permease n=1 Tax=Desulfosarcina sp. TaxID=2027861 RepID=UPI003970B324
MRHMPTILRQVRRSSSQSALFVLCVALSLTTLTAFSGFARSVGRALIDDARSLHAADIIIKSYDPISAPLTRAIGRLVDQGRIEGANVHEFYSVVRAADHDASVLSRLKVVQPNYPFYGQVTLKSGRPFQQVLVPGACIVEQSLLDRTGLAVGSSMQVGYATLSIADVVTAEPDRPLDLFTLGPRVFIHDSDLDALGLMGTGSRIRRIVLLKVLDPLQVDAIADQLKQASRFDGEQIDTHLTAGSAVKRFLNNFLFFLKLVGLFILIVSGLGIQSTLTALFNEKQRTIAVMKAVGATGRFINTHFMRLVMFLGAMGTGVGILAGLALQGILAWMLSPFLPDYLGLTIAWSGVVEAIVLGAFVVALFSFLPLYRLREMRPVVIFNRLPSSGATRWPYYLSAILSLIFFLALVLWHMRDIGFGFYFVGAITALILAAGILSQLALWLIKRLPVRHLALRQSIKGLFRRGNATRSVMITLTVSLAVIFGNHLIEKNLTATFVQSFPADSANVFFVDIQPGQTEAFKSAVNRPVQFYPIIRARITAINAKAIDRDREGQKQRDNLSRVFNLTYREFLLDDETLIAGDSLFRSDWVEPQVSVMDTVIEMREMKIGDRISFKIQGVPLTARISSIRTRDNRSLSPFFYFVFPNAVLAQAPQTLFASLRVAPGQMGSLQTQIVSRFPNISVIDMTQTIGVFARMMARLSRIVRLFSLFSIAAGILILVSAIFATRAERVVESVYYKILGAGRHFVRTVFALENVMIGLLSSVMALLMAQAGAYWVCRIKFDIGYQPFFATSLAMVGLTVLLVVGVGMTASRSIMAKKPVTYLREQQNG